MARARLHLLVSGRVQGVTFRASTTSEAQRLGLDGWVRNLPDGRVEVEAEGERGDLEALLAWCRRGPPAARVDALAVAWDDPGGDLAPFSSRR
jgi:acylphosphatase